MYKIFIKILICALVVFIVGSAGGTAYLLYNNSKKPDEKYATGQPFRADIQDTVIVSGKIVPKEEIKIKPKIPGIIGEIRVEPGDTVSRNDVLAKITVVPDQTLLNEGYNRCKTAKVRLVEAEQHLDRCKKLHKDAYRSISTEDLEAAEFEYKNAKIEVDAAENNLKIIKEGAFLRQNTGEDQTLIRATIGGTILEVPIKVGDTIIQSNTFNEGTTIAVVADMQTMVFEGEIDESEVDRLKEGMLLRLKVGAIEDHIIDAVLSHIAPKGNIEKEGQVKFKIMADIKAQPDITLRAGYSANAEIILARRKNVLSVNESSLCFDHKQRPYVEVLRNDQTFEKRYVKIGLSDGIHIEIIKGLTVNDTIKTDPL